MTTVYQIGKDTMLTKDMIFGWVLIRNADELVVMSTLSIDQLQAMLEIIPNTPIYEEVRKYIFAEIATKQNEELAYKAQQLLNENAQKLAVQQQQDWKAKQQKADQTRLESAQHLENLMRDWFEQSNKFKIYEVKDETGHVYARVVPGLDSYTLLTPINTVVTAERKLSHIVSAILNRWW